MENLVLHMKEPIPGLNAMLRAAGSPRRGTLAGMKLDIQKSVALATLRALGDAKTLPWASHPMKVVRERAEAFAAEKRGRRSSAVKGILEKVKRERSADEEARQSKKKSASRIAPEERPVVIITSYRPRPLEDDDYVGGGKFHVDALRYIGLILDDKQAAAVIRYADQEQCHRDDSMTRIAISRVEHAEKCEACGYVIPLHQV